MDRRIMWSVIPFVVMAAAGIARADTVTKDGQTSKLAPNQVVTGPATIRGVDANDTIELRKGAVVQFLGSEVDEKQARAESYFLKSGAVDASIGFYTRVSTPSFWAFPSAAGQRASFYAESFGVNVGYARAKKGSGMVRLLVDTKSRTEVMLHENQGVTVDRTPAFPGADGRAPSISFATDAHNDFQKGLGRLRYPLDTGLVIELFIPKATAGYIRPKADSPGKTVVKNSVSSWKAGKIQIVTLLHGSSAGTGEIGPGVEAVIDNASGKIEIGFVAVDFTSLKAAVSLTSEFESLALSPIAKP
jgi:hypothetical protein